MNKMVGPFHLMVRLGIILGFLVVAWPIASANAETAIEPSRGDDPTSEITSRCTKSISSGGRLDRFVVSVPEINLRTGPGLDCDIKAELKLDTAVFVVGDSQERDDMTWVPVTSSEGAGFVFLGSIQETASQATCGKFGGSIAETGEAAIAADIVNLRSGPGVGCSVVAELTPGTPLTVMGAGITEGNYQWVPVSSPAGDGFVFEGGLAAPGSILAPASVAVLMYHDIGEPADRYRVTPRQLEQHVIFLRDNGYTSITPRDLVNYFDSGVPLPPRPVILSVDDGWASARVFRDVLGAYGFRGTYFLPNYAELGADEIYNLNQYGEVCGHSVSHQFTDLLTYDGQVYEVSANKQWLDSVLGQNTTCFAYPFGSYSDVTTQVVANAGYQIAFDAWHGRQFFDGGLNRWHIQRIEVSGAFDLDTFAAVVGY